MRKILILTLAVCFAFALANNANACGCGGEGTETAEGMIQFQATSSDYSDATSIGGYGNDWAVAGGSGGAGGMVQNYANSETKIVYGNWQWGFHGGQDGDPGWYIKQHGGPQIGRIKYFSNGHPQPQSRNEWIFLGSELGWYREILYTIPAYAEQGAEGNAFNTTHSCTYAWDFGRTSMAGAFSETVGWASASGWAEGNRGYPEMSLSKVWVGGSVFQEHYAAETGYSDGSFVEGGNYSGASFYGESADFDMGFGSAGTSVCIFGQAFTGGNTYVTIDPYGSNRSIDAYTSNYSGVRTCAGSMESSVVGEGFVNGLIQKGSVYAGGASTFGYNGANNGFGAASLNASITVNQHSSTASASSYSVAGSTGVGTGLVD